MPAPTVNQQLVDKSIIHQVLNRRRVHKRNASDMFNNGNPHSGDDKQIARQKLMTSKDADAYAMAILAEEDDDYSD